MCFVWLLTSPVIAAPAVTYVICRIEDRRREEKRESGKDGGGGGGVSGGVLSTRMDD